MQSAICLQRLSNSPPLNMQFTHDNQEDFVWVVTWAKKDEGKGVD